MNPISSLRSAFARQLVLRPSSAGQRAVFLRSYSSPPATAPPADEPSPPTSTPDASASTPDASPPPPPFVKSTSVHLDNFLQRTQTRSSPTGGFPSSSSPTPTSTSRPAWQNIFDSSSFSNRKDEPGPQTPQAIWQSTTPVSYSAPVDTTSARSVRVMNGIGGLASAWRTLNRILMENNVRREVRRGERFEGGSDKRVRLDSERHRRRFKVAVGRAVSQAMRASKNS